MIKFYLFFVKFILFFFFDEFKIFKDKNIEKKKKSKKEKKKKKYNWLINTLIIIHTITQSNQRKSKPIKDSKNQPTKAHTNIHIQGFFTTEKLKETTDKSNKSVK